MDSPMKKGYSTTDCLVLEGLSKMHSGSWLTASSASLEPCNNNQRQSNLSLQLASAYTISWGPTIQAYRMRWWIRRTINTDPFLVHGWMMPKFWPTWHKFTQATVTLWMPRGKESISHITSIPWQDQLTGNIMYLNVMYLYWVWSQSLLTKTNS